VTGVARAFSNAPPTHGDCEGGWIWAIDEGEVDGVDLRDRAVAVFADWPGAIHQGGGQASAFIDDGADDSQADVLTRVPRAERRLFRPRDCSDV